MSCKSVLFVSICLLSVVIFVESATMSLHRYGSEGIAKIENLPFLFDHDLWRGLKNVCILVPILRLFQLDFNFSSFILEVRSGHKFE